MNTNLKNGCIPKTLVPQRVSPVSLRSKCDDRQNSLAPPGSRKGADSLIGRGYPELSEGGIVPEPKNVGDIPD